jgi:hypothetical protein
MEPRQRRSAEFSNQVQGWVSDDQFEVLEKIRLQREERTGKPHRIVDALRHLLDSGKVKRYSRLGDWSK